VFLGVLGSVGSSLAPRQPATPPKVAASVTADELLGHYQANEVAADRVYKGRYVEVRGVIDNIGKDILDNPYVALRCDQIFCVQCFFDGADAELARLQPRRMITIRGRCEGKFGNVILKDCLIVKEGL
jgi:hypothetical protein